MSRIKSQKKLPLIKTVFAGVALLGVSACTTINRNPTADHVPSADEFRARILSIEPGDSLQTVQSKLEFSTAQFDELSAQMDDSNAYAYVYGDQVPLEGTRLQEYDRLDGFTISYRHVEENLRYNPLNTLTRTTGDDLSTVIIFRDGSVINNPGIHEIDVNGEQKRSHLTRVDPMRYLIP